MMQGPRPVRKMVLVPVPVPPIICHPHHMEAAFEDSVSSCEVVLDGVEAVLNGVPVDFFRLPIPISRKVTVNSRIKSRWVAHFRNLDTNSLARSVLMVRYGEHVYLKCPVSCIPATAVMTAASF